MIFGSEGFFSRVTNGRFFQGWPERFFHGGRNSGKISPRAYARGGLGLNFPLKLDILQKLNYLRKGD